MNVSSVRCGASKVTTAIERPEQMTTGLVQAKTSGTDGAMLGWEAVKDVVTGEAFYQRRHPDIDFDKVCITNQFFNRQAKENAGLNSVKLLDQSDLAVMLEKYEITMLEVDRLLFAEWQERDVEF